MGGRGRGWPCSKNVEALLPQYWVHLWGLGLYKSCLMVVQHGPIQKLPHVCPKWGAGVKATFGQCPKERSFFSDGFPKPKIYFWLHTYKTGSCEPQALAPWLLHQEVCPRCLSCSSCSKAMSTTEKYTVTISAKQIEEFKNMFQMYDKVRKALKEGHPW